MHQVAQGFVGDDPHQGPADGQMLLNQHADQRSAGESQGVGHVGRHALFPGQHARDHADPDEHLDKAACRREVFSPARDERHPEGAHADIANAGDDDKNDRKNKLHKTGVHSMATDRIQVTTPGNATEYDRVFRFNMNR